MTSLISTIFYVHTVACSVVVGEYCRGKRNALTPDTRDKNTQQLYDSTVGLLNRDKFSNPSIFVTFHDAQAYPEVRFVSIDVLGKDTTPEHLTSHWFACIVVAQYLITFKTS